MVNWSEALGAVQGDKALLQELSEIFLAEYPALLTEARTALERGDAAGLQHACHTLRGSVRQFCAKTVEEGCSHLETVAGAHGLGEANGPVATLECELGRLAETLRSFLADRT